MPPHDRHHQPQHGHSTSFLLEANHIIDDTPTSESINSRNRDAFGDDIKDVHKVDDGARKCSCDHDEGCLNGTINLQDIALHNLNIEHREVHCHDQEEEAQEE